jgi:hypothetical protein
MDGVEGHTGESRYNAPLLRWNGNMRDIKASLEMLLHSLLYCDAMRQGS